MNLSVCIQLHCLGRAQQAGLLRIHHLRLFLRDRIMGTAMAQSVPLRALSPPSASRDIQLEHGSPELVWSSFPKVGQLK